MNHSYISALLICATIGVHAQVGPVGDDEKDPTLPSPRLRAALRETGGGLPDLSVAGMVVGVGKNAGAVALRAEGGRTQLVRPPESFTVASEGGSVRLQLTRISAEGVEILAAESGETIQLPGPRLTGGAGEGNDVDVAYAEFRELPLIDALRLLSDQTGRNFAASAEANKIPVNVFLREVSAEAVVEEICKGHHLWFRRDERSGILRIMTVAEFEKDLTGFREEQTEVFTLKYPNVTEIGVAIADLFGDRVQFSLGGEEADDDMRRDLEGRFDRYDVLAQRTQNAGMMQGQSTNILGANVNGFYGNGAGLLGFAGTGGMGGIGGTSRFGGDWDNGSSRIGRDRHSPRDQDGASIAGDDGFRPLTSEQAQRVDQALLAGGAGAKAGSVEDLRSKPATIFVTGSRRNNLLVVRTADERSLADIRDLVRRMDVPTSLVLLEVQIVSIELGNDFRSAFDYHFNDGQTAIGFSREGIPRLPEDGEMLTDGPNPSDMTFVVVNDNFRARIQFFEQKNRVKTLATPTLLTANNEVSRLFLGEERPLVRGISSQTIITDNNVATTPNTTTEFRPVGNTLLITPNINSDRTVTLRLVQEHSFINPDGASIPVVTTTENSSSVQDVKVDVVATRSISGTFVAKDGMSVAAGGLIEDIDSTKRGQVPLLGDIPWLGVIFRRDEIVKSRRELVIVIKPHVLSTPADGERISEAVLQQLAPASVEQLAESGLLPGASLFPDDPPPADKAPAPTNRKSPGKSRR